MWTLTNRSQSPGWVIKDTLNSFATATRGVQMSFTVLWASSGCGWWSSETFTLCFKLHKVLVSIFSEKTSSQSSIPDHSCHGSVGLLLSSDMDSCVHVAVLQCCGEYLTFHKTTEETVEWIFPSSVLVTSHSPSFISSASRIHSEISKGFLTLS